MSWGASCRTGKLRGDLRSYVWENLKTESSVKSPLEVLADSGLHCTLWNYFYLFGFVSVPVGALCANARDIDPSIYTSLAHRAVSLIAS